MSRRFVASFLLLLLITFGSGGWRNSLAQSGGGKYFEETRHWVRGEFLIKYNSAPDPLRLYGYPITPAFLDKTTNQVIQYFQKARFELHPEAPPGEQVQLSLLGSFLYEPGSPLSSFDNSPTCRKFGTEYNVCMAFVEFYIQNGGEAQFGKPISGLELQNKRMVQYFENARFEWRSDYPPGMRVALGDLGSEHFYKVGYDRALLLAEPTEFTAEKSTTAKGVLGLKVRAYPLRAVTSLNGTQSIYIVVQDQSLLPVEGVQITLDVRTPDGKQSLYIVRQRTNAAGMTQSSFPFALDSVGIVQVNVTATYKDLQAKTTTSFRAWW